MPIDYKNYYNQQKKYYLKNKGSSIDTIKGGVFTPDNPDYFFNRNLLDFYEYLKNLKELDRLKLKLNIHRPTFKTIYYIMSDHYLNIFDKITKLKKLINYLDLNKFRLNVVYATKVILYYIHFNDSNIIFDFEKINENNYKEILTKQLENLYNKLFIFHNFNLTDLKLKIENTREVINIDSSLSTKEKEEILYELQINSLLITINEFIEKKEKINQEYYTISLENLSNIIQQINELPNELEKRKKIKNDQKNNFKRFYIDDDLRKKDDLDKLFEEYPSMIP